MSDEDNGSTRRVGADEMSQLRDLIDGEEQTADDPVDEVGGSVDAGPEDAGPRDEGADDDDLMSTQRVSASQMNQLQELLHTNATTEVPIEIARDVMERVDALIPKMDLEDGSPEPLQRAMAVRQIFMTGLYAMESELGD